MLTSLDDSLWHQLPTTFDHVGTSDPRFFDRHWLAIYAPDGSCAVQVTMGAYRNMNVLDGAVVVVHEGQQHNLRVSRSLGEEIQTSCGPLTLETTVPLQEIRISVSRGDHGIAGELVWQGVMPPAEEKPHFNRVRGRVVEDYRRFDQSGTASGWLEVDGDRIVVDRWWGCRDHSWGVRPRIGIREPVTGHVEQLSESGFAMAFLFFSTEKHAGHIQLQRRVGVKDYVTGDLRVRSDGTQHTVVNAELTARLHEGTRRFRDSTLTVQTDDGRSIEVDCEALGHAIAMQGLGYSGGYDDGRGLGVWRGDQVLEADTWDVSDPATIAYPDRESNEHWHRIQPVRVTMTDQGDVSTGVGSMTLILSGHLPEFGLA